MPIIVHFVGSFGGGWGGGARDGVRGAEAGGARRLAVGAAGGGPAAQSGARRRSQSVTLAVMVGLDFGWCATYEGGGCCSRHP